MQQQEAGDDRQLIDGMMERDDDQCSRLMAFLSQSSSRYGCLGCVTAARHRVSYE